MKFLFLTCPYLVPCVLSLCLFLLLFFSHTGYSSESNEPSLVDTNLRVERVFGGLHYPTTMTFLGANDILVLNKNTGTLHRIVNGVLLKQPLLDVNVANKHERGMLGIATIVPSTLNDDKDGIKKYVFLYYTESNKDGNDVCRLSYYCEPGTDPLGNRLYRYELEDEKLLNPKLLLDLPATPGPTHNGGAIEIGPDNNVYVTIGDIHGHARAPKTKAMNFQNGTDPDGRSGILRITQDGKFVNGNLMLEHKHPLNFYYGYGIRNSFGIDFDLISGKLWDTENGPDYGDEINLVEPGFNSGWIQLQGIWKPWFDKVRGGDFVAGDELLNPDSHGLVDFDGQGEYSEPEFIWKKTVGPTAIKFFHSDKYGKEYKDDLFVGDFNNGYLYHFDLNKDRSGLVLKGTLEDKIADTNTHDELNQIKFGEGFGRITDIEVGPDGYLYILTSSRDRGNIYKIIPTNPE